MSSRFANERVTDLDDEIRRRFSLCQNTLDKLPLTSRYPELNPRKVISDSDDIFQMLFTLNVATVMPPEIRTLSTVMLDEDHHRADPLGMRYSSQPSFQGFAYVRSGVVASVGVAFFTDTPFNFSQFAAGDACLSWCARAVSRHLRGVGQRPCNL